MSKHTNISQEPSIDTLKTKNHASTSKHNKEILTIKESHEETKIEVYDESYINELRSQLKKLDLNKMISGND